MKISDVNPVAWVFENRIRASSGEPFDLRQHFFWYDFLNDLSPHQVMLKAAQGGGTEVSLLKSLYLADRRNMSGIYTMPTASDINILGGRVNRLIQQNPSLAALVKDKDTIEQKQVRDAMLYFRGCVDEKTELLTERGWCTYGDVKVGDRLPTLNMATNTVEMDSVSDMTVFDADEEMVEIKSVFIDQLVTADHRCVVAKRRLTCEKGALRILRAKQLVGKGSANFPMIHNAVPSVPDPFYKILGWVIGDGSYWTKRDKSTFVRKDGTVSAKVYETPRVCIIQAKLCDTLEADLASAGIRYFKKHHNRNIKLPHHLDCWRYEIHAEDSVKIRQILHQKKLTHDLVFSMTQEQRHGIYLGLLMSDGDNYGEQYFYQNKNGTCDAFQALCVLLGKTTNLSSRSAGSKEIVTIKRNAWVAPKPTVRRYKGKAWCPTTKNGTIFIRRNGKVSVTGQTWTERAAISVPADFLVHDEEDRSNGAILKMYPSRLLHSPYKWDLHFSNPSFPGHGVDGYWQKSDQKHWFIKCHKCNGEQYLAWPESIDRDRKCFVCKKCASPMSREDRRKGRWVKRFRDKMYSGYWISALMYPWLDAPYFIEQFETKPKDYFWNFVLGLPFVSEGSLITPDIIYRNCTSVPNSQENVVIGVDVGNTIHYVVGNEEGLFYHGKTEDPEDLDRLLMKFQGSVMVIDRGPDVFYPKKLREKFSGRVFICSFARVRKTDQIINFKGGEEYGDVLADRNRSIQLVVDEFADRRIPLQGTQDDWSEYYSHWNGMTRRKDIDAVGNPVYVWEKSDSLDHFCLATTYWRIGMEKFGSGKGEIVESASRIRVPIGHEIGLDNKTPNPLSYAEEYDL